VAAYEQRYGALVAAGLPLGLPSVSNPNFNRTVFLDQEGRTKPQLRWIVPDDRHAAIYVRPREGLDQTATDRLVRAVRAEAHRALDGYQPPPPNDPVRTGVTVTGAPVLVSALGAEVRRELPQLALVAFGAVALAYLLLHRPGTRPRGGSASPGPPRRSRPGAGRIAGAARWVIPLVLGPAATAAVLGFFGIREAALSLGMLAFLPVMLGVGSDMPIQAAYPGSRRILVAAGAASAAGFAALALSPLPFVRNLGLALAAGVAVSTLLALLVGPAAAAATGVPLPVWSGKRTPVGGRGFRRWAVAGGAVLALVGWGLLPSIPVEARPERLASGLPALEVARRAEQVLGASGEVAVRVQAADVASPAMLDWFRRADEAVVAPFGDRIRPVVSPLRLLSWLGEDATPAQIDAALGLLPRYLVGASVRSDRREAVASYGLPLGDLEDQSALLDEIRAALPAPPPGAEVAVTGLPVVASRGYDLLSDGRLAGSLAGPLAAGAVLALLVPRRRHALLAAAAALLAIGWGALALRIFGVDLNPLTVGLGSLTAAVGCEFTLFTLERRAEGQGGGAAFRGAVTAGAVAAAGFASLAVSRLDVLAGFGLVLAGSVLLALLAAWLLAGLPGASPAETSKVPDPDRTAVETGRGGAARVG
jgi:predicted RND superfamily exporter protein